MNTLTLLRQMCHNDLSQADIKAIGKSRGFLHRETASRSALESVFLSPAGVERAMAALTPAEAAMLHFLHRLDRPVSVDWFERLYRAKSKSRYYASTYTQRYQPVLKQVRTQLVRKGLLVMAQAPTAGETKMERWRFVFPPEFAPYLPSPLGAARQITTPGETRQDKPRQKLLSLAGQPPLPPHTPEYALEVADGRILLGRQPFTAAGLEAWRRAGWQAVLPQGQERSTRPHTSSADYESDPIETLTYGLGLLGPDEWVLPEQLDDLLKIFCLRLFDADAICRSGWRWGFLARNKVDGRFWYRLAGAGSDEAAPPDVYLTPLDEETALVDLQTIPYRALEQLNQIAFLQIKEDKVTAVPHLARLGAALPDVLDSPLLAWLAENVPAFAQAQKTAQARWGKQIIHTNLRLARVKDLALRVKLEKTLKPHEFVCLSDEYVAFTPKALPKVTRIVTQAGHVIREV